MINKNFNKGSLKQILCLLSMLFCFSTASQAASSTQEPISPIPQKPVAKVTLLPEKDASYPAKKNPVDERLKKEQEVEPNSFAIVFHKPTYVLPYYYTGSPYNGIYINQTPEDEKLKRAEVKYQLSFKVPLWKNILHYPSTLYFAYTQMSYWQVYDHDPFFRETDYEPELFVANAVDVHLFKNWRLNFINLGAVHQSNGFGGALERSWNRVYFIAVASSDNWIVSVKPWAILRDNTYERQNPDMATYMGYGSIIVAYKYNKNVFSLETHNLIESGGRRSGTTLSWSFPLTDYLRGYVQGFSGYGQSLIEYNHRTNSIGVGFALSDWV